MFSSLLLHSFICSKISIIFVNIRIIYMNILLYNVNSDKYFGLFYRHETSDFSTFSINQHLNSFTGLIENNLYSYDIFNLSLCEDYIFLHDCIYKSGKPNYLGQRAPILTNWNISSLGLVNYEYKDKDICKLLKTIRYAKDELPISDSSNHRGAELFPDTVDKCIEKGTLL